MRELRLYDLMDRIGVRNYRAKILVMAFIGTHIPLIGLTSYIAVESSADWSSVLVTLGVTLAATLFGTGLTLLVLSHLLRPLVMTSRTLRTYVRSRRLGTLPTSYTDEVGTLMSDTAETLAHLERVRDALENIDPTTGLPNRRKLLQDIATRSGGEQRFAACVIRFANYARLVETLDLEAAETASAVLAGRLGLALRDGQALYRVNSSDFVWLTHHVSIEFSSTKGADLQASMQEIIGRGSGTIAMGDVVLEPVLHGGVALFPDDASWPEAAIDHAIAAAAQAVDDLPVSFHSPATRLASVMRLRLEQDLRKAVSREEFVLHYQPVVDLAIGRAVGAEALIRWQNPERGLIPPLSFITVAETTGLIDPIGLWVMRNACLQVRDWNTSGLPGMRVAINLSARQFLDPDLARHVDEAIRTAGISPDQLEVELTETAAMADHAFTRTVFGQLRDLGVTIAIDDFGTGFASMSYLRKLPFDKLKIDREFVSNVNETRDSKAICGALVTLAQGLGLRVQAEGTETPEEIRYLWSRGCDLYQGYYFARPLTPDQFRTSLDQVAVSAATMTDRVATRSSRVAELALAS